MNRLKISKDDIYIYIYIIRKSGEKLNFFGPCSHESCHTGILLLSKYSNIGVYNYTFIILYHRTDS